MTDENATPNYDLMSLDELFAEAAKSLAAPKPSGKSAGKAKLAEAQSAAVALYANPENWRRGRAIVLLDRKTSTCLGNFSEYTHRTVPNCRKLIREELPVACAAVEYIDNFHGWTAGEAPPRSAAPKRISLTLSLEKLAVRSLHCTVLAHSCYGDLTRVELADDTTFVQTDAPELLLLPAGTDVLEVLSRGSITAINQEIHAA